MTTISSELTAIYFVVKNFELILKLIADGKSEGPVAFNSQDILPFYNSRARHLQIMALIGLTSEHLIKSILQKRGYSICEVDSIHSQNGKNQQVTFSKKRLRFGKQ